MLLKEKDIDNEIEYIESLICSCDNVISKCKQTNARLREQGRHVYISIVESLPDKKRHEKYLSLKNKEAEDIVNQIYAKRLKPALEKELLILKDLKLNYDPKTKYNVIKLIPQPFHKYLKDQLLDTETKAAHWETESFKGNSYLTDEETAFITDKGEYVRSKAEYIIAGILNEMGLHYRYECAYKCGDREYYPDFTVMHPESGELYYIEYFGLMNNPEYAENALQKISKYQSGKDSAKFIFFFESQYSPMNIYSIKNTFENIFFNK